MNVTKVNKKYTGKSVKVAIIESYIKNVKENYFVYNSSKESEHSYKVAETIKSIAPDCELYNVVIDTNSLDIEQIKKAIQFCIARKVDVINMSFAVTSVDQELIKLVEQARDKGIAVVAASGNSGVEM